MSQIKVSVIIVSYNSLPALVACLRSLDVGCRSVEYELIIVDNNSEDGSVAAAVNIIPQARIIKSQYNRGFGAACNMGAESATGEYLLFLNPDVVMDEFALKNLVEVVGNDQNMGAVGGRLRFADGSFQASCRCYPTIGNLIFSRGSVFSGLFKSQKYTLPDYESVTLVPAIAGTLMLVWRSLFERIGGFDEKFFMFMEDTDLCYRINLAGYQNVFVPQAGGIHNWGTGSNASRLRRARYHHLSMWKYLKQHTSNRLLLLVLPLLLFANFIMAMIRITLTAGDTKISPDPDSPEKER